MRISWRWLALIVIAVSLFCWKILFTRQFSLLLGYESANQAYAWYHYSAAELQNGSLALWDPYTHSGRSFIGEMQTALFYPPKVLLYLWPFNRSGFFSPQLFHDFYVLTHILAAFLMFALAAD